ncbi:MAG: prepilin-type N-terminal cleavage/methylation domain-containing protein [Deltaproteobacteria bacterium]|nr:prepilin-type N-terminal cleavage/methylation domain-containing protein [Deltaproteobacteria bacterium]
MAGEFKNIKAVEERSRVFGKLASFAAGKLSVLNGAGFTLMEIIVAMIVVGILSAGGLMVYNGLIGSSNVTAAIQSISKLESAVNSYMQVNGGSIIPPPGVALPYAMQEDNLLPSSWTVNGNNVMPPNQGFVESFYIAAGANPGQYNYVIGINAPQMTNAQALNICDSLENSISGVDANGNVNFNIGNGQTCLSDLFGNDANNANSSIFQGNLTFTFN